MKSDKLIKVSENFIKRAAKYGKKRYIFRTLVGQYKSFVSGKSRAGVIFLGLRGIGKTIAMLQFLGNFRERLYIPADHPVFAVNGIYESFISVNSDFDIKVVGIDEVHKVSGWENEVKAIVDEFPEKFVVVTGSSSPKILEGAGALKRRMIIRFVSPMSFEEFLEFRGIEFEKIPLSELLRNPVNYIPSEEVEREVPDYLGYGGFPIFVENLKDVHELIFSSIMRVIEEDLNLNLEQKYRYKKFLYFLALSKPGEMSYESLSRNLGVGRESVYIMVEKLSEAGVIRKVDAFSSSRKMPKLMFAHPSMRSSICRILGEEPDIGALREEAVAFKLNQLGLNFWYVRGMRKNPDFVVKIGNKYVAFEVGGRGKGTYQLRDFDEGYVIGGVGKKKIPFASFLLTFVK